MFLCCRLPLTRAVIRNLCRLKSARANAGFEEQLGLFETWDGISHQNIKRRDILDLFPNAAVPADDGNSVNSELTLWDSDFEPELEHKELNNKLAREAAASKKDAFESKMKSRRAAEFAAEHSSDEDDVPVRTVDSEDLIEARPKWVRRKRYSEAEPGSNGTTWYADWHSSRCMAFTYVHAHCVSEPETVT